MAATVQRAETPERDVVTEMAQLADWALKDVVEHDSPVLAAVMGRILRQGQDGDRPVARFGSYA